MDVALGKLRWRCRRGMKELDALLTRYVDEEYATASAEHRRAFVDLLELQDPLLAAYVLGRESPPEGPVAELIARIAAGGAPGR